MQLANAALVLRPRSPWEAMDLGLAILQGLRGPVYAAWCLSFVPLALLFLAVGWALEAPWLAFALVWWLKPLYDRTLLHVLSRGIFGVVLGPRAVLADTKEWLGHGLIGALLWNRFELARSYTLPVRQLEGQSGREARERVKVLSRRTRSYAVWLTVVCVHFEAVLMWSGSLLSELLVPVSAAPAGDLWARLSGGDAWSLGDLLLYALAVSIVEPFYVAAGFALYLNRRTLLEGWDIEVALRGIVERRAHPAAPAQSAVVAGALLLAAAAWFGMPPPALAQTASKDAKRELAEVLKAPEFQTKRETTVWQRRAGSDADEPRRGASSGSDASFLVAAAKALAVILKLVLWGIAAALVVAALWWLLQQLPREAAVPRAAYRPPPSLFGMDLAPETLPADVAGEALALARTGRMREALALLYRGTLFELVQRRGVELRPSDTEDEALLRVRSGAAAEAAPFFAALVAAWQAAAYAGRLPQLEGMERLARDYAARFAPAGA